jgi:alpha-D-ribose 1-methylphosphonate 5-triphosphate synthase subunit PhnI
VVGGHADRRDPGDVREVTVRQIREELGLRVDDVRTPVLAVADVLDRLIAGPLAAVAVDGARVEVPGEAVLVEFVAQRAIVEARALP